jgi:hypothetical protein
MCTVSSDSIVGDPGWHVLTVSLVRVHHHMFLLPLLLGFGCGGG